jgi:hypothetical protein
MDGFLRTLLSFPAVPFTVLLGISFLYWLFVLLGVVAFDGDGALEGGVKAAGDALTGGVKAAGDAVTGGLKGAAEAAGDAVTGGLKGAAEAAGDAVAGGSKGAAESLKAVAGGAPPASDGVLSLLGFGKVPTTISGSLLVFFGWVFSMFGSSWLGADASLVGKSGVLFGAMLLSLMSTSVAIRPLVKAFHSAPPARRHHFIGKVCEITSGRVDGTFGTATVGDGGAGLNLHVVCEKANGLKKGDKALIIGFDDATETWEIEPMDWLEPQEIEALNDPQRVGQVISSRMRTRG